MGFEGAQELDIGKKYPDILFKFHDHKFIIQVKIGKIKKLIEGLTDASEHANLANIRNVIVLVYPESVRRYLHNKEQLKKLTLETEIESLLVTQFWIDHTQLKLNDLFKELKNKIIQKEKGIPSFKLVTKTLRESIEIISELLRFSSHKQIHQAIDEVVGRFDMFLALGQFKGLEVSSKHLGLAAIDLTSYLLVNQILFYHIYNAYTKEKLDPLPEKIKKISDLEKYFNHIQDIDYRPIYAVDIVNRLPNKLDVIESIEKIIKVIKFIEPEKIKHDLLGRLFQQLLPPETRKILAAFYTNPLAAELLAGLTITRWDESVIDPACGSGTLLVAAYRKKFELYPKKIDKEIIAHLHKKFVQNDITGLDIMPFAAHLTALNLSSQTFDVTTNILRVGITDSLLDLAGKLKMKGGFPLSTLSKTIQKTLQMYNKKSINTSKGRFRGAISLEGKGEEFKLFQVDCLLMNPPFSDREKLPKDYINQLKKLTSLTVKCGNQINLWGYFIALADEIVKKNGKIGTVVSINILRGQASQKLRNFIIDNYKIKYIIKSMRDLCFSEGAYFRDILLILEKKKPTIEDKTCIILLKKSLHELSLSEIKIIEKEIQKIKAGAEYRDESIDLYWINYKEVLKNRNNLMPLIAFQSGKTKKIIEKHLETIYHKAQERLIDFPQDIIKEGFHTSPAGLSEILFITRITDSSRIKRAFLVLEKENETDVEFKIKGTKFKFKISKKRISPAIRTITGVKTLSFKDYDYILIESFKDFETILTFSKFKKKNKFNWDKIKRSIEDKKGYLLLPRRFNPYSPNTSLIALCSDKEIVPTDAFKIISVSKSDSEFLCLYFNSIVYLLQLFAKKQETTGQYTDIRGTELVLMKILDISKLNEKHKQILKELYKRLIKIEFPSLKEQFSKNFKVRRELDRIILKILGLQEKDIEKMLDELYLILIKELESYKDGEARNKSSDT